MTNEMHELPRILCVLIAVAGPRRHCTEPDSVLNDQKPAQTNHRLSPVRIIVRIPVVAAAAGAKLAQVLKVSSEHITVAPMYPVGLGKVLQVVNRSVELTGVEFAPSPSRFEFLKVP